MPSEWKTETVINLQNAGVLRVEDGNHGEYRPRSNEFSTAGIAFIRAADIQDNRILFEDASKINSVARARITKGIGAPGDVILTHKGTVGKVAVAPMDSPAFVCSPQTTFWRVLDHHQLERGYLYAFMRSPTFLQQLHAVAGETDMAPYASLTSQRRIRITIPPIGIQRQIAKIALAIEHRIKSISDMNQTLEATARATFKSWFVDFDPVRAKAEGREPGGMDAATATLFVSEVQDSKLGAIPKGWNASSLEDDFQITMGQSPPGNTYNEAGEGLAFYQGSTDFGFRFPAHRVYCSQPTRIAKAGDTLVSVRAPVGDVNMALERCSIGRGVSAIRHRSGSRSYTYYAMKELNAIFSRFEAEGTVFGSISKTDLRAILRVSPPPEVIEKFEHFAFPFDERIAVNAVLIRTLSELRDILLPRLISGKLRVLEAEAMLAEVG
jgi:type I restriction enzyme S subunit